MNPSIDRLSRTEAPPDHAPGTAPGAEESRPPRRKVVALGGGHGLWAMLGALRRLDVDITAIVTVADDGGSSGRLRREIPGLVPPGDLRMALAALARDDDAGRLWARTFQHRFTGEGALTGHPVGNLILVGLTQVLGNPVAALDAAADVLGCCGRVLPMSTVPLEIVALVQGLTDDAGALRRIRGQVAVATTPGRVVSVSVEPTDAPGCPDSLHAIASADLVILGPGSWFTSVLPHLLLPSLRDCLIATPAHRLLVLNLAPQPGETDGFSPQEYLDVLSAHAPAFRLDSVLADRDAVADPPRLRQATDAMGARLYLGSVAAGSEPRHDPTALAAALREVLDGLPPRPFGTGRS